MKDRGQKACERCALCALCAPSGLIFFVLAPPAAVWDAAGETHERAATARALYALATDVSVLRVRGTLIDDVRGRRAPHSRTNANACARSNFSVVIDNSFGFLCGH